MASSSNELQRLGAEQMGALGDVEDISDPPARDALPPTVDWKAHATLLEEQMIAIEAELNASEEREEQLSNRNKRLEARCLSRAAVLKRSQERIKQLEQALAEAKDELEILTEAKLASEREKDTRIRDLKNHIEILEYRL